MKTIKTKRYDFKKIPTEVQEDVSGQNTSRKLRRIILETKEDESMPNRLPSINREVDSKQSSYSDVEHAYFEADEPNLMKSIRKESMVISEKGSSRLLPDSKLCQEDFNHKNLRKEVHPTSSDNGRLPKIADYAYKPKSKTSSRSDIRGNISQTKKKQVPSDKLAKKELFLTQNADASKTKNKLTETASMIKSPYANENSTAAVHRLLKSNPRSQLEEPFASTLTQLEKNKEDAEAQKLRHKISRSRNLIEEDDPDDADIETDAGKDSKTTEKLFRQMVTGKRKPQTKQSKSQKQPQVKRKWGKFRRFRTSKSKTKQKEPNPNKCFRASPLVSFPAGLVLTQSLHKKPQRKNLLHSKPSEPLTHDLQNALDDLMDVFVDRHTYK